MFKMKKKESALINTEDAIEKKTGKYICLP